MNLKLKRISIALVPAIGLSFAVPALAADTSAAAATSQTQQQKMMDRRATQLIGADVHNANGENLGEIKDVIVDVNNGRVHYAVLSFGGVAGLGDKLFAYPMRTFKSAADRDELVLNVDKAKLEKAPGFEARKWPDWNDRAYRGQVDRYFGDTVTVQQRPNQQLVRLSKLMDADVVDANGRDIGDIEELVVRLSDGSLRYALVEFDDTWRADDKLVVVPPHALSDARTGDDLKLQMNRETVANAPAIDGNKWPDLNDPAYRTRIDNYLDATPTADVGTTETR